MKNEEIYKLINDQRLEIKKDVKEAIKENNSLLHAQMIMEVDRVDHKLDTVIAHNEWQNGMLSDHEKGIRELKFFRLIGRNPKISAIIFIIVVMSLAWGYHNINLKRTIKNLTKIELNEGH